MSRTTAQRVAVIPGMQPIEDFVDGWSKQLAEDFARQVRTEPIGVVTDDMPVLVDVLPGQLQRARSASVTDDGVVVATDTRSLRGWTPDGTELTWNDLRAAARSHSANREHACLPTFPTG